MTERTPRYTLEGPCHAWAFQGRDGRWYRVCVPCDTVIKARGLLPRRLAYGFAHEHDALMSVRDHVRQMTANRAAHVRGVQWRAMADRAAVAGDFTTYGRAIMRDMMWEPGVRVTGREEQLRIMGDWLARRHGTI